MYFLTDLRFATGTVICMDKIYNGMGCIIHINVWRECVQTHGMELVAVFHCYVSKGIKILTNNCLQEKKKITDHCYIISLNILFSSDHIGSDAVRHVKLSESEFYVNCSCVVYDTESSFYQHNDHCRTMFMQWSAIPKIKPNISKDC